MQIHREIFVSSPNGKTFRSVSDFIDQGGGFYYVLCYPMGIIIITLLFISLTENSISDES